MKIISNKQIGYCGYSCYLCNARSNDPKIREEMIKCWKKIFGQHGYTPENVKCVGCLNKGKHADENCKVRPCAIEKKVKNCAYCKEFPCEKISNLITSRSEMMLSGMPKTSSITEEEYDLCMKQFESLPNLFKILLKIGKLPNWLKKAANVKS